MAEKQAETFIKLQIAAGQANPAPPVGPALGQHGINIQDFCTQFNNTTKAKAGQIIPVVISVYKDKTFSFVCKTPPAQFLIKQAISLQKGSGEPNKVKVGKISWAQCIDIAKQKLPDLNSDNPEQAAHMIAGTARSMGVQVEGLPE